jgi:hypothetical protein
MMSPTREIALSLNDVEEMILGFERKYSLSSADFFSDPEVKQQVAEDDIFQWDMLIYHRLALKESSQEIRSTYLAQLGRSTGEDVRSEKENQYALAA